MSYDPLAMDPWGSNRRAARMLVHAEVNRLRAPFRRKGSDGIVDAAGVDVINVNRYPAVESFEEHARIELVIDLLVDALNHRGTSTR